jgi:hypothetical protein
MTLTRASDPAVRTAPPDVVFIQNAVPPLRDGTYLLSARQAVTGLEPGTFQAAATFVVSGERFTINPAEIDSVFPPSLAGGEFGGVLPHVVFNRRTLPWERRIDTPDSGTSYPDAPWLAVLVSDENSAPDLKPKLVTARDLVPAGTVITVQGSTATGIGTLPATTLSYGAALLHELEHGETPDDPCLVVDLPVALFSQLAPAAADLAYLAHIREVDTSDGADSASTSEQHAVAVANRVPAVPGVSRAFLVSLEAMAAYLPEPDGTPSGAIGPGLEQVRLLVYQSWTFTVNDLGQTLEKLLEGLNAGSPVTTLTLPITGDPPTAAQVARAMAAAANGAVSAADARVLMQNALLMGYVPLDHHLRQGGRTVSCYRGPLVPLAAPPATAAYYSGPDAANAYDPQTGMFDVSYGAAWQLGQLLALQSSGLANELYQWKHAVARQRAIADEQALLTRRLAGTGAFASVLSRRAAAVGDEPPLPDDVVSWFGSLATLQGVPFSYLVPDERLLPPESMRFFLIDAGWIDALIDGAFSVGRATVSPRSLEARHAPVIRRLARSAAGRRAANRLLADGVPAAPVSGFLLRSQAVAGWPNLRVSGYRDTGATDPIDPVRITRLSADTMLCLFNDVVGSVYLREPPEQLHHGVEGAAGNYHTILRSVNGGPGPVAAGQQYASSPVVFKTPCDPAGTNAWTCVPVRDDGRTLLIADAAAAIEARLAGDFQQRFPNGFTAAEFALELTKGVMEVEFTR